MENQQQQQQTELINQLLQRVNNLETTVAQLKEQLAVTKHVNTLLSNEVDNLQQYQRRSCVVIAGLQSSQEETPGDVYKQAENVLVRDLNLDREEIGYEIDKCHRIGPVKDDGTQDTIIRFRSHNFRERVYIRRKKNKNTAIKVKLSLTKKRRNTLKYAYKIQNQVTNVDFFYADIHGNLKFRLKKPINNKTIYNFTDQDDLKETLLKLGYSINDAIDNENGR